MTTNLSIDDVFTLATGPAWFQRLIDNAGTLGLNASAWQSGSVARQIVMVVAYTLQFVDVAISGIAQGGFLDFAASGSITYTDAKGVVTTVPVTPEGGPGWLDILADSRYDVQRIPLTSAGGALAVTNTSATTYGPFTAGTFHVANPTTKSSYASTTDIATIPPSPIVGNVSNVVSYFGQIQINTSAAHGLTTGAVVNVQGALGVPPLAGSFSGRVTVLSSTAFVFDDSLFSGTYTSGGVCRRPTLVTATADVPGTVGNSLGGTGAATTNTVTELVTNLIGVSVANIDVFLGSDTETNVNLAARCRLRLQSISVGGPKGAYRYFALSSAQYAPKLTPPQKIGSAITRVRTFAFPSNGFVYVVIANNAGPSSAADVSVTDQVIQANAVPQAVTAIALAATRRNAAAAATVWLPAAYVSATTRTLFESAVQAYFSTLQIGGESDPQGSYSNILPLQGIAGAIFDAAQDAKIPIQNVAILLNGVAADLQLVVDLPFLNVEVAVLSPSVPSIALVAA